MEKVSKKKISCFGMPPIFRIMPQWGLRHGWRLDRCSRFSVSHESFMTVRRESP